MSFFFRGIWEFFQYRSQVPHKGLTVSTNSLSTADDLAIFVNKTPRLSLDNHTSHPAMNVNAILKTVGVLLVACGGIASLAWEKTTAGDFIIAAGFLAYLSVLIGEWWGKK